METNYNCNQSLVYKDLMSINCVMHRTKSIPLCLSKYQLNATSIKHDTVMYFDIL